MLSLWLERKLSWLEQGRQVVPQAPFRPAAGSHSSAGVPRCWCRCDGINAPGKGPAMCHGRGPVLKKYPGWAGECCSEHEHVSHLVNTREIYRCASGRRELLLLLLCCPERRRRTLDCTVATRKRASERGLGGFPKMYYEVHTSILFQRRTPSTPGNSRTGHFSECTHFILRRLSRPGTRTLLILIFMHALHFKPESTVLVSISRVVSSASRGRIWDVPPALVWMHHAG